MVDLKLSAFSDEYADGFAEQLSAMRDFGITVVTTYVPWCAHEPTPGNYCFEGHLDLEYFLVVLLSFLVRGDSEDTCQGFRALLVYLKILILFEDKVHLCVADEYLFKFKAVLIEQPLQREFRDDVLGTEECVHLCSGLPVANRILVHDEDVLEHECREWLEMDLFESYLSLNLLRNLAHYSFADCCLHLWKLYRE